MNSLISAFQYHLLIMSGLNVIKMLFSSVDKDNRFLIMKLIVIALILAVALSAPAADRMTKIPGYPSTYNTSIYSGYLDVKNANRSIHYVFVQSVKGANNSDPVTLWLNGGPGCSSLLGFIQEIGPYYLQDGIDFKNGDNLTQNKYSWHKRSNLLFFESPAGVGYSVNLQQNYSHNDAKTANDNLNALLDFFNKYPQYRKNTFFIAGQSYAGKYIPDLAVLIDMNNQYGEGQRINLKSIIIGNGVMTFSTLQSSTYQYMIDRSFVDPEIIPIYKTSCQTDPDSAGCRYFTLEFDKGTEELNPYNVYGYCYYNDSFDSSQKLTKEKRVYHSQESILQGIKKQMKINDGNNKVTYNKYNGAPCAYFDGIYDYFHLNDVQFHAKFPGQKWNGPCAEGINYSIDPDGSMYSYRHLLGLADSPQRKISIILYNGNWDAVVPYVDTLKGLRLLNLVPAWTYNPWFTDSQHSGFQQLYSGFIFITVKGASHQVPQAKRAEAFNLFDSIVQGHKSGTIFEKGVFGNKYQKTSVI